MGVSEGYGIGWKGHTVEIGAIVDKSVGVPSDGSMSASILMPFPPSSTAPTVTESRLTL